VSRRAQRLLDGAVDLHVHPAPSPYPRRIGPIGAAQHAADTGVRAMALKSHHHSTATDVAIARGEQLLPPGVELIGGIVLNSQVGGFNPHAVALSLALGGRIVWLPTISSPAHIAHVGNGSAKFPSSSVTLPPEPALDVWDAEARVLPQVREVLTLVAEADAVLASGHLPAASIIAVFELARELGVRRLLVNHPNFIVEATPDQVARLVALGAYVEHASCHYDEHSRFMAFGVEELVRWIKAVGPQRTTLCSDLGQEGNPLPAVSLSTVIDALHDEGFTDRELQTMLADNPARLVGLDGGEP
jgi:hypothetical protein